MVGSVWLWMMMPAAFCGSGCCTPGRVVHLLLVLLRHLLLFQHRLLRLSLPRLLRQRQSPK